MPFEYKTSFTACWAEVRLTRLSPSLAMMQVRRSRMSTADVGHPDAASHEKSTVSEQVAYEACSNAPPISNDDGKWQPSRTLQHVGCTERSPVELQRYIGKAEDNRSYDHFPRIPFMLAPSGVSSNAWLIGQHAGESLHNACNLHRVLLRCIAH